jgi:GNAT superfamily N-acetyltransferase
VSGQADLVLLPAGPEDAADILALQKAAYQSEARLYDDWTLPPLTQSFSEIKGEFADTRFLKAVVHGHVIGSVRATLDGSTCRIGRLIVHPDHQGKGIGSLLMAHIEQAFPEAERFELFTGAKSIRNMRLYRRLGYRECRETDVSPTIRLVFMEKRCHRAASMPRP